MTLKEALQITTIREDELERIDKKTLQRIITKEQNNFLTLSEEKALEAWKTIYNHLTKEKTTI